LHTLFFRDLDSPGKISEANGTSQISTLFDMARYENLAETSYHIQKKQNGDQLAIFL
jgi:hypothetical protein